MSPEDIQYYNMPVGTLRRLGSDYRKAVEELRKGEALAAVCEGTHTDGQSLGVTYLARIESIAQWQHLLCLIGDKVLWSVYLVALTSEQQQEATRR